MLHDKWKRKKQQTEWSGEHEKDKERNRIKDLIGLDKKN